MTMRKKTDTRSEGQRRADEAVRAAVDAGDFAAVGLDQEKIEVAIRRRLAEGPRAKSTSESTRLAQPRRSPRFTAATWRGFEEEARRVGVPLDEYLRAATRRAERIKARKTARKRGTGRTPGKATERRRRASS